MISIYTAGYQAGWSHERLQEAIDLVNGTVVDVRLRAWSKDERWQQSQLEERLSAYVHVPELGNVNYRGGPIRIQQPAVGIARVKRVLERRPVILLCGCWNVEACHRTTVAKMLAEAIGETQWMDFGRQKKAKPAEEIPRLQL